MDLEKENLFLQECLEISQRELNQTKIRPLYHHNWTTCCCCQSSKCCQDKATHAIEYYQNQLLLTKSQLDALYDSYKVSDSPTKLENVQCLEINESHTGVVFVGLATAQDAANLLKYYKVCRSHMVGTDYTFSLINQHCPVHQIDTSLGSENVMGKVCGYQFYQNFHRIHLAPPFTDLLWENLAGIPYRSTEWWCRLISIRAMVFVVAIVLTSPVYLLSIFNVLGFYEWITNLTRPLLFNLFPAAILAGASLFVTQLVIWCENWTGHKTHGDREYAIFRNAFIYLLLTVFLFPLLGITGYAALASKLYAITQTSSANMTLAQMPFQLECIFLPDSGVLFICYVVTCGLIGSGFKLLCLSSFVYDLYLRCCKSHSSAEKTIASKSLSIQFPFGENYAFVATIHTIIVAILPVCPIIQFFGLVYFFFTYLVEKYMLVSIYTPVNQTEKNKLQTTEENYSHMQHYHLKWYLQASRFSLIGICFTCIIPFVFFLFRWSVKGLRYVTYAYGILTALVIIVSIILSVLVETHVWSRNCNSFICQKRKQYKRISEQHILDFDSQVSDSNAKLPNESVDEINSRTCTCSYLHNKFYTSQQAYTVPVLRYVNDEHHET